VWGAFAVTGIVLGAAYMLWLYQRTMFGEITKDANKTLPDLDAREMATLIPIIVFCFWIGLYPAPFLRAMESSVANVIQTVEKGSAAKAVQGKRAAAGKLGNQATGQLGNSGTSLVAELPNRQNAASKDREGAR
jgi:NADH-quinone oxidoreductase subunit M